MVEYHEELEIDLLPDHDLLDLWRGTLSFRRLDLLIQALPATSRVVAAINPDAAEMAQYSVTDYLLMNLFDINAKAHFKDPDPHPRPADLIAKRHKNEQMAAFLERQAERNRQRDSVSTSR